MLFRKKIKKHMFIIVRYSLASSDKEAWKIGANNSFEEYKNSLFENSRLESRERLFKTVTLPALISMRRTTGLTLLMVTSDLLPKKNKERLENLLKPYDWAKVYAMSPEKRTFEMIEECLDQELSSFHHKVCYSTTRLDDDDALAPYFCEELNPYLSPNYKGFCVSFPKGYAGVYVDNEFESFYDHYIPKIALGLSYIDVYDPKNKTLSNIYTLGNHTRVDHKTPTILDSRRPMYLRTLHSASDSNSKITTNFNKMPDNSEIVNLFSIKSKE